MRYLVINHSWKGTYYTNSLTKEELVANKERMIDLIVDLQNETYFDPETNSWKEIQKIS